MKPSLVTTFILSLLIICAVMASGPPEIQSDATVMNTEYSGRLPIYLMSWEQFMSDIEFGFITIHDVHNTYAHLLHMIEEGDPWAYWH